MSNRAVASFFLRWALAALLLAAAWMSFQDWKLAGNTQPIPLLPNDE